MRAILIDPEKRSLTEIQLETGDFREINRVIGANRFTSGAHLGGSISAGFDMLCVSDDLMEEREEAKLRHWFQVDAGPNPSSYPIAGRGLATGVDKAGETCDLRIGVDELRSRITFTQRTFRGFETFTGAEAQARGADFVVEMKAPIIDGTEESA